jgi:MFS family permease
VSRVEVPDFIREVFEDAARRNVLIACLLAVLAVGLVPYLLSPGLPSAQEAIRQRPEIQNLFLLLAFTSTATILIGGLVSDIYRHRSLMVGGLLVMMVGSALSIVIDDGSVFYVCNFAAAAAAGVVLAYGIGSVAIAYQGIPRATALGFVYAAFGVGAAASPAVLTLFPVTIPSTDPGVPPGFTFDTTLAHVLAAVASAVALWSGTDSCPRSRATFPPAHGSWPA